MPANLPQASPDRSGELARAVVPAAVAVVQSVSRPPDADWSHVADYCADTVRVGVSGQMLALLIERLVCHGVLDGSPPVIH